MMSTENECKKLSSYYSCDFTCNGFRIVEGLIINPLKEGN